jgi:glycosyltransferase involved in cell wall biosynthesis
MQKISVIITVYNRVNLLRKALISLNNQSVAPDELIISDDGSDEDIPDSISDIISDLSFKVKYVKQENKGFRLARCRNNGIRISKGDLLIFIDQDIICTENLLKTCSQNQSPKRFITSHRINLTEVQSERITEEIIGENRFMQQIEKKQLDDLLKEYRKDKFYYYLHKISSVRKPKLKGQTHAINREDFELVNGYDENYVGWGNEDDDMGRRLYIAGIHGYNPFKSDFPIHQYHEPFHQNQERVNLKYDTVRDAEVKSGDYRCRIGLDNDDKSDILEIKELN